MTSRPRIADDYEIIDGRWVRKTELLAQGYVRLSSGEWVKAESAKELEAHLAAQASQELPGKPSGFSLTRLSDLLAEPAEQLAYVWHNTLPKGGLSILVAKPKAGKSTLARNLALKIARGDGEFLGRAITASGPVVYLALEEKRSEVRSHFERMGATEDLPILIHVGIAPQLAIDQLRKAVIGSHAVLAIVDPLQRMIRIADLNDYSSVSLALEPLMHIARDTGCHILLVHHANKGVAREGGDAILGSTAIFGSVDCALIMKRTESYRTIESIQRYGEDIPKTVLSFDAVTGISTSRGTAEDVGLAECWKDILEFLVNREPIAERDIKEGVPTGQHGHGLVSKSLRKVVEQGKVVRQGSGKRGDPYLYSLAVATDCRFSGCEDIDTPTKPSFLPERGLAPIPSRNSGCVANAIPGESGNYSRPRDPTGDLVTGPPADAGMPEDDVGEV